MFSKTIVFLATKRACDEVANELWYAGLKCDSIHGDKEQRERDRVIGQFRRNEVMCLIATDVAARGLDVSDVTNVVQIDFPAASGKAGVEDYIHRIGRTGRAGRKGEAHAYLDQGRHQGERPGPGGHFEGCRAGGAGRAGRAHVARGRQGRRQGRSWSWARGGASGRGPRPRRRLRQGAEAQVGGCVRSPAAQPLFRKRVTLFRDFGRGILRLPCPALSGGRSASDSRKHCSR